VASLIVVKPGLPWLSSGGMFGFASRYLAPRLSDRRAADWLPTVCRPRARFGVDPGLPAATQEEIFARLRRGLLPAAVRDLPDGPAKGPAAAHLQELVRLTYRDPE
jgi:hypothetical protein